MKCTDVIRLALDTFNAKLLEFESSFYLDDSDKAMQSYYELGLPDDEDTGEPDEDLP